MKNYTQKSVCVCAKLFEQKFLENKTERYIYIKILQGRLTDENFMVVECCKLIDVLSQSIFSFCIVIHCPCLFLTKLSYDRYYFRLY